jgi:hypothetical protein
MVLDVLSPNNNITCNRTLAKSIGLEEAIYCTELLNIYSKAVNKKKTIDNDFFKIDRTYVYKRTLIPVEKQLQIDASLESIQIIIKEKSHKDVDIMKLDVGFIANIVMGNEKLREDIVLHLLPRKRMGKKKRAIEVIKNSFECKDSSILNLLRSWVDVVGSIRGKLNITPQSAKLFQEHIDKYSGDNIELKHKLIKLAIETRYWSPKWVTDKYEKENKDKKENMTDYNDYVEKNIAKPGSIIKKVF